MCKRLWVLSVSICLSGVTATGSEGQRSALEAGTLRSAAMEAFEAGRYAQAERMLADWVAMEPDDLDASVRLGWSRYRQGRFQLAEATFAPILEADPDHLDARTGLGYARLQSGKPAEAAEAFERVLAREPMHEDALSGLALAMGRQGRPFERRLRTTPAAEMLRLPARAGRHYLELREPDGSWQPIFIKGFNLGAALPGRYPSEFPEDEALYRGWLDLMADLGANTVRLYTLLPPAFYRALQAHNEEPGARRLWLIQGVWTELPQSHDFLDEAFVAEFEAEIARVIDAVHGNLLLGPRPGHASGRYDTDASGSLLAYVVGREWEPFAVLDFNAMHRGEGVFEGRWFSSSGGAAMEAWVARMCDLTAGYEAEHYGTLRPITFANWPTLDPLHHPTEATRDEENAWRSRLGLPLLAPLLEPAWEDDAVTLDATLIRPTEAMEAGFFAAYHIYPNFPDFLNLDPRYEDARDADGPSRYAGYLRRLKAYHGEQPVLVAEFGISTSRGIAHLQPQGWHHGGHDEREQGELEARLLRSIHDEGYAGGIVFSFLDEWFKGTWSATPLEIPPERRRLWFNAESPEQSYGILAARPAGVAIRTDGDPSDWADIPLIASRETAGRTGWEVLRSVRAAADEGYLHLLLETAGGPQPPDWSRVGFRIALDTYDPDRGESALPPPGPARVPTGVEFLVDLMGPGRSAVMVSAPYEPYARVDWGPVASPEQPSGRFVRLVFETNRERIGRDGTRYPALTVERGALRYGSLDAASSSFDTRTDVAIGTATGTVELRLPWALLNISDPSSRRVIHQPERNAPPFATVKTDGIRIYAFAVDPSRPDRRPLDRLPDAGEWATLFRWAGWDEPRWRLEPKDGAEALRDGMNRLPDRISEPGVGGSSREVSDVR
jgi:tetratricopeptide (TPR) repeat protein